MASDSVALRHATVSVTTRQDGEFNFWVQTPRGYAEFIISADELMLLSLVLKNAVQAKR